MRSENTLGAQPNEVATQTDEVSVDEDAGEAMLYEPRDDERIETPEELMDIQEQNEQQRILLGVNENISYAPPTKTTKEEHSKSNSSVEARNVTEWRCANKKELRLHKAKK